MVSSKRASVNERKSGCNKAAENNTSSTNKKVNKKIKKKGYYFQASATVSLQQATITTVGSPAGKGKQQTLPVRNSARLPASVKEASSNWKALCSSIKPACANKRRPAFVARRKAALVKSENLETDKILTTSLKSATEEDIWFDGVDPLLLDSNPSAALNEADLKIPGVSNNKYFTLFMMNYK